MLLHCFKGILRTSRNKSAAWQFVGGDIDSVKFNQLDY